MSQSDSQEFDKTSEKYDRWGKIAQFVGFIVPVAEQALINQEQQWLAKHIELFLKYPEYAWAVHIIITILFISPALQKITSFLKNPPDFVKKVPLPSVLPQLIQVVQDAIKVVWHSLASYYLWQLGFLENLSGLKLAAMFFTISSGLLALRFHKKWIDERPQDNLTKSQ